ncbi:hypothetical protein TPA0909_13910 [Streptomyces albus]|nr:hypothetical protein TPA0909_13910 [Streptomyces albus]
MELTYHDIMKADFSGLTTAAQKWRDMADAFGSLHTDYKKSASKRLSGWQGESSAAYRLTETQIFEQLTGAKKQARSMAKMLDAAQEMLTSARDALKAVRDSAMKDGGMKVDEYGKCTLDTSEMTREEAQSALRDPSRADTERQWNAAIQRGVAQVEQVDLLVKKALEMTSEDGDPRAGVVGFNTTPPRDFAEFTRKIAEQQAERAKDKAAKTSPDLVSGISQGLKTFATSSPGLRVDQRLLLAVAEGATETAGYNNTKGICLDVSGGIGVTSGGVETCLVTTKRPDGGTQVSALWSPAVQSAGWESGVSATLSGMKSNADDIEQLKGGGWNKGAGLHAGPGAAVNYGTSFGSRNDKGDLVQTFSLGAGAGVSTEVNTGFTRTYGTVLWESPKKGGK